MKVIRLLIPLFALGVVLSLGSCESTGHSHEGHTHGESGHAQNASPIDPKTNERPHGDGPEYTSKYICPMHCEGSGSSEPGQCPACGMDYVLNVDHVKDGHSHDGQMAE